MKNHIAMDSIDEYLRGVAPKQRAALGKLRRTIRASAPGAVEGISYGLAAFRLDGRPLVAFGAGKSHCSFFPMTGHTVAAFRKELTGFKTSKGTIRFDARRPLPAALVRKIVKARIAEVRANGGKTGGPARGDPIAAYARDLVPALREACDLLRGMIDAAMPRATSKVWHGSPVWFVGENPVVGYSAKGKAISLLFWNGQAMGEERFRPVGKYGAAEALFGDASEIDAAAVRRWLKWAKANVFDSVGFFKKLREQQKRATRT